MNKYKNLLFLIPFSVLLVILLDVAQNVTVSYTNTFISFLNVIVMGVLTYYIYRTNSKLTEVSEKQIRNELEFKINPILSNLDQDINSLYNYSRFLKNHYSIYKKQEMLLTYLEKKQPLDEETIERIKEVDANTKEGYEEINKHFKKLVVIEVFTYGELSNIEKHIEVLKSLNSNSNYRAIYIKFNRDLLQCISLSERLKFLLLDNGVFDMKMVERIGDVSSMIDDIVIETINDLETAKTSLEEKIM